MLVASNFHCFNLKFRTEDCELFDLLCDLINVVTLERLLATGTGHESKCDAESGPLMLEELNYAISMKHMTAS